MKDKDYDFHIKFIEQFKADNGRMPTIHDFRRLVETPLITAYVRMFGGISQAANALRLHRNTVHAKIDRGGAMP